MTTKKQDDILYGILDPDISARPTCRDAHTHIEARLVVQDSETREERTLVVSLTIFGAYSFTIEGENRSILHSEAGNVFDMHNDEEEYAKRLLMDDDPFGDPRTPEEVEQDIRCSQSGYVYSDPFADE